MTRHDALALVRTSASCPRPHPDQRRPWRWLLALTIALVLPLSGMPADESATAQEWRQTSSAIGAAGRGDPELDAAWDRAGCELNPGNPSCVIIGNAATCAELPGKPECTADRDSDRCLDIAEVRAGLDPLDGADCLGDAAGAPLLNCLFLIGNEPCHGDPGPALDCPPLNRDPGCDGFAPQPG